MINIIYVQYFMQFLIQMPIYLEGLKYMIFGIMKNAHVRV
jgi:hypothetical protein